MINLLYVVTLLFLMGCSSSPVKQSVDKKQRPPQLKAAAPPPRQSPEVQASPPSSDSGARAYQYEVAGNFVEALKEYLALSNSALDKGLQDRARAKAVDLIESKMSEADLISVSDDASFGLLRAHAFFRLGESSLQRRDYSDARRNFASVQRILPESDLALRSQEYLTQIENLRIVEGKNIGVILPLTGKNANVSRRVLRAVQLGFGLENSKSPVRLSVMDSEGNPDLARQSVDRLVKEDKVVGIIGGLIGKTAIAESSRADELGVPSLLLSQKSGITDIGTNVFRNALTSDMQVQALVKTAFDQGHRRFAIIYPNDSYGVEFANLFWDAVLARGGVISAVQTYNPKETDFRGNIQRMVGTFYLEARIDEFKAKSIASKKDGKGSFRKEKSADDILPPIVDFDAVFIPDNPKTMGQIAAFLSFSGVRNVKLLGTNLWNTPDLAKRAGNFANDLLFVDGIFASSNETAQFFDSYLRHFGETPSLVELQAYDTALILKSFVSQGLGSREDLTRKLSSLKRFQGAQGPLTMSGEREILRPVVSLSLDKSGQIIRVQ